MTELRALSDKALHDESLIERYRIAQNLSTQRQSLLMIAAEKKRRTLEKSWA